MFVIKHKCTDEYLSEYGRNKRGLFVAYTKDRNDAIEFYRKEFAEKALEENGSGCMADDCTVVEEAASSSGFKVLIETVDMKALVARGSLFVEGEATPRKFSYYHTYRHMKPRGCEGAWGTPIPVTALRTVPPKLQEAVGRKKFVRIFNQISDAMWATWACHADVSEESIFSPQAKQQITSFQQNPPEPEGVPGPEDIPF